MNRSFRRLDEPARLCGLSFLQWSFVLGGGGLAGWLLHLSGIGTRPAITLWVLFVGGPAVFAVLDDDARLPVGRLARDLVGWLRHPKQADAQELAGVAEITRDGVVRLADGGLALVLRAGSVNPLVLDEPDLQRVNDAFARVLNRIPAGRSLQFLVEATPLPVEQVIAGERDLADRAATAAPAERAAALRRLAACGEQSLVFHAPAIAAVEVTHLVVCPWAPPRRRTAGWEERAHRELHRFADEVRHELETAELPVTQLTAGEVERLLADRVGEADLDLSDRRFVRRGGLVERSVYVGSVPAATWVGWPLHLMQVGCPFTLSVHFHALDRYRQRTRQRYRYRRILGVNRGNELRGKPVSPEAAEREQEAELLDRELAITAGAGIYKTGLYLTLRNTDGDEDQLVEQAAALSRELLAVTDARLAPGWWAQQQLWVSSLPLGRDVAGRSRRYATRNAADTVPLVGTGCGSPAGVPLGFAQPGRTLERLDPFDPAHDNHLLVVNGKSGSGKTMTTNLLLARLLAQGATGHVIDRAGHYDFLASLIPDARTVRLGAGEATHAINPWDVADARRVPPEKVDYLLALHALLIGHHDPGADSYGLSALEQNLLGLAIRAVYERCCLTGEHPAETLLQEELQHRSRTEQAAGSVEIAGVLRTLAERLHNFTGPGTHAYLTDRVTTVPAGSPLVVFDTRSVPDALAAAALFVICEHVTRTVQHHRDQHLADNGGGGWSGRSFLVVDEAWKLIERPATGRWVNELARRSRHLVLFLVAISQSLSDFTRHPQGEALLSQSSMQLFLKQSPSELEVARQALRLSDSEVQAISQQQTAKRRYATAFLCNGTRGRGTVAIKPGPFEYWLATSDPERDEPLRRQALRDTGGDPWRALALLADRHGS